MKNDDVFGYWQYYSDDFDWVEPPRKKYFDKEHTFDVFKRAGLDEIESNQLWESGYGCCKRSDIIIDRYYGGLINSSDLISRLMPSQVNELFSSPRSRVWVKSASSLKDVHQIVSNAQEECSKQLLFRGQLKNYFVERKINNPYFTIHDLGEISILSSFWRKALSKNRNSFIDFESLFLFEWSKIFYTAFDIDDIEERHAEALKNGEYMYSMQDMADSDDPILSEFGNHRLDLTMGMNHNLADTLSTLLQHYGLLSTVIDLTTSLDVSLFFATHKYSCINGVSNYDFVGTNNGRSVLYLIRSDEKEMVRHYQDRVLDRIPPERPKRQHCVVSRSSPYAVNLPAFYLEGIINLEFDLIESELNMDMRHLFPDEEEDQFLKAIKKGIAFESKISHFGTSTEK